VYWLWPSQTFQIALQSEKICLAVGGFGQAKLFNAL